MTGWNKIMIEKIKEKWLLYLIFALGNAAIFFAMGCPSKVISLTDGTKRVTRAELQIELDHFIASAQMKLGQLDKQDELRDLVLKNAFIMVETGTFNPIALTTALFALYGIGNAANQTKNGIKKIKKKTNGE